MNKIEMIYMILSHSKTIERRIGTNLVEYSLKSLRFEVPKVINLKIKKLRRQNKFNLLRQLIVIHKDHFRTNFDRS